MVFHECRECCCGTKIGISSPLQLRYAEGSWQRAYGDTKKTVVAGVTDGVWRNSVNGDGLSNGDYIFRRAQGRLTSSHDIISSYIGKYRLYFSRLLVALTVSEIL